MVELQHASQALPVPYWTFKVRGSGGIYESVVQALMGPLLVAVTAELPQSLSEVDPASKFLFLEIERFARHRLARVN